MHFTNVIYDKPLQKAFLNMVIILSKEPIGGTEDDQHNHKKNEYSSR